MTVELPPRVLVVMPSQWPRALLRAALREEGYDAIGTQSLGSALRVRASDPERGPVRLIIVDQAAMTESRSPAQLERLCSCHRDLKTILIARVTVPTRQSQWDRVLSRPVSVGEIVDAVKSVVPLAASLRHNID